MQSVSLSVAQYTPATPADTAADAVHDVHIGSRVLPAGWKDAALFMGLCVLWMLFWVFTVAAGSEMLIELLLDLASAPGGRSTVSSPALANFSEALRFTSSAHSDYAGIIFFLVLGGWIAWWSRGVRFVEVGAGGVRLKRRVGRTVLLRWEAVQQIKRKVFAANSMSVLRNYRIAGAGRNWRYAPADAVAFEAALARLRPPAASAARPAWGRRIAGWTRMCLGMLLRFLCICVCFAVLVATIKFVWEPAVSGTGYLSSPLQRLFLLKPGAHVPDVQAALLANAVKAGSPQVVSKVLERMGSLREVEFKDPILEVAIGGRKALARDRKSPTQSAPAYDAEEAQQRAQILQMLIARGAHVDPGVLLAAALVGNLQSFETLRAAGAPLNDVDEDGTPDVAIAARESLTALTLYLDAKADPNQAGYRGYTPLMMVARSQQSYEHKRKSMELLVARGARLDRKDDVGATLAHALAEGGDVKLLTEWIARSGGYGALSDAGRSLMHTAAGGEKTAIIQELIKNGVSVNSADRQGDTPLHFARTSVVVAFLVAQGADVNARNSSGRTPLHAAASDRRRWDAVPALLNSGARKDLSDSADAGGRTALDYFNDELRGMAKPPRNRDELVKLLTP